MGQWPEIYPNAAIPHTQEYLDQFFRTMTPDTGAFDGKLVADGVTAVFEKSRRQGTDYPFCRRWSGLAGGCSVSSCKGVSSPWNPGTFPFP